MDVDSQPTMEETILVGDDLIIASHVLQGVDLCDGVLRNLFLCLQINDIDPFAKMRSSQKLGLSMPLRKRRKAFNLQQMTGSRMEGFRPEWSCIDASRHNYVNRGLTNSEKGGRVSEVPEASKPEKVCW
ncbi:unnamed protein product [Spirodela intermedia]|uniref:DUF7803 domain-containing protein n=1 Tax=Spirodela intermedia TaxID=51605 RepID=A0A7I8ICC5_SPIIN|nr:unnamed protein product [Spirodela intermedia]CAA6655457.1 unnamed protein product [Spirodela intermedia]